jgi:RHS repeat-associated protein
VLTGVTDPNGNLWALATDNQGRVTSSTDPLGRAVKYSYDSRSRISAITSSVDSVQFSRDPNGNITQAAYSDGTTHTYVYDNDNRIVSGSGFKFTLDANGKIIGSNGLTMTRDAVGRITSVTYSPGKTATYVYDARGLLASVTDWTGGSVSFTFNAAHRLVSVGRSNGVSTTLGYDQDSRVISIQETAGTTMLSSINLTRDAIGRVTAADRNIPQEPAISDASTSVNFDAASQIAGASYDARGRLVNDHAGSTYHWNAASRMLSYSRPDGSASVVYSGLGQRISRTGSDGVTRNYVINYATEIPSIAIIQSDGSDLSYYVYTPEGLLLYSIDAVTGAHRFYSFDESGSTLFLTGDNGAMTDSYGISPYGDAVSVGSSNTMDNPFIWRGQFGVMQEPGTKLYYAGLRYYDAGSQRFLSRDLLISPAPKEVNPYQYAAGNPVASGNMLPHGVGTSTPLVPDSSSIDLQFADGGLRQRHSRPDLVPSIPTLSFEQLILGAQQEWINRLLSFPILSIGGIGK